MLTAPYRHDTDDNRYARHDVTPTVAAFEAVLGELEGGTALAFASGMAAMAAVVEGRPAGTVAVVPAAAYSGTVSIFEAQERLGRMTVRRVDIGDTDAVVAALDGADLRVAGDGDQPADDRARPPRDRRRRPRRRRAGVRRRDVLDAAGRPRPLELGADVVMHSVTKYLSGHSDVLMGALVVGSPDLAADLHARRTLTGAAARRAGDLPGHPRPAHAGPAHGAGPGQRRSSSPGGWPRTPASPACASRACPPTPATRSPPATTTASAR